MSFITKIYPSKGSVFRQMIFAASTFFCFAPYNFPVLYGLAFLNLWHVLENARSKKKCFIQCFLFFAVFASVQIYWIGLSFNAIGQWYYVPLGTFGAAIYAGILYSAFTFPALYLRNHPYFPYVFSFLFFASQIFQSYVFLPFPWNLSGYIWGLEILQITQYISVYGLSLLTMVFIASLYRFKPTKYIAICLVFVGLWAWGYTQLKKPVSFHKFTVRMVQPSFSTLDKADSHKFQENLNTYLALSENKTPKPVDLLIWPEAALPFAANRQPDIASHIATETRVKDFLMGGIYYIPGPLKLHNSLYYFQNSKLLNVYHKNILVPLGEYIPLKKYLPFESIVSRGIDYDLGNGPKTYELSFGLTFAPQICFESAFPFTAHLKNDRPDFIVNVTNDSWFGNSVGPHQHLKIAQVRAIELGLPILRCANNGISAIILPNGSVYKQLDLNVSGTLDGFIPKRFAR